MRKDDRKERTYFRSERIAVSNGQWFFATREGEEGPFRTRDAAERALARYIHDKVELEGFQKSRTERPLVRPVAKHREPVTLELVPIEREAPTIEPHLPRIAETTARSLVF